jgi:hypothetical protein
MRVSASVPHLRITGIHGQGVVVHSRSVLVHRPSRLGAAAAVLGIEVQCGDGVFTIWTGERG